MTAIVRPAAAASPCIGTCKMNPVTNLCEGCARTLVEIANWGSMSNAQRASVRADLPARQAVLGFRQFR